MLTITALIAVSYLAIGTWMLIDMESRDRLGFAWTDIAVVLAAPIAAVGWAIWCAMRAVAGIAAAAWAVLTRPWR